MIVRRALRAGVAGSAMAGHLVLAGRTDDCFTGAQPAWRAARWPATWCWRGGAKDTIVLSSGENVEPAPLEDAVAASPFIAHAVVVGQDRRALGALVVPAEEAFAELATVRGGAPRAGANAGGRQGWCCNVAT